MNQKGSAVLEMALILPLLLTFLFGIVEFSRILSAKQVITNAAREGARAGAVDLNDAGALTKAQTVSQSYLTSTGMELKKATIKPSFVQAGGSAALQVVIDYRYDSLLTTWIPGFPASFTLESAAIMRRES